MLLAKMVSRRVYCWRLLILINGRMNICTIRQQTYRVWYGGWQLILINGRMNICTIRQQTYREPPKNRSYDLLYIPLSQKKKFASS